jgi:hypothetical protein
MLMLKHTYKSLPVGAWSHYPEISIDDLAAASKSTGREVLRFILAAVSTASTSS